MGELILVRHSLPAVDPDAPACEWRLSEAGRARCTALAAQLAPYAPAVLASSTEPKALETAHLVAAAWELPASSVRAVDGLREHDRRGAGFLDRAAFEAAVARFFASPAELVFGRETADQLYARFSAVIDALTGAHPGATLAVFTHGTVMSLYVSRITGAAPFPFWKRLDLPAFTVLGLP
ncbi:MAG: histidine phosphatase family protein [Anaerolineae bacterium]|nr:histidine phosphatase family protein [Anaerolineae bacterium]